MSAGEMTTLKTSSILFVGGFLFMAALALLGSAGAALGSSPGSDAADREHPCCWTPSADGNFVADTARVPGEAVVTPLSHSARR